jgi:hypothetical protein
MPGWLTTAANVFRKQAPPPVQTYSVRCGCGRAATGTRTASEQVALCPACQSSLFIFPASVYPAPPAPPPKPKKTPPAHPPAGRGRSPRGKAATGSAAREHAPSPGTANGDHRGAATAPALPRHRRKLVTPLRAVAASLMLVVAGTVWWLFHLKALDRARETIASAPHVAEEAIQQGDIQEAARQYEQIREAVARLGRDDAQALRWNQLARETAALSDLAAAPLHSILQEAIDVSHGKTESAWGEIFRGTYRGGWVLIDAPVSRSGGESGRSEFQIDFPLAVGEQSARLVADLPDFRRCLVEGTSAKRVIFAAQLADCRKDSAGTGEWRIEFRPETGFLWSSAGTYQMAGLPSDESSLAVLAEQSRLLGIEP